jgi:predicted dinucleotide-binding enzyme
MKIGIIGAGMVARAVAVRAAAAGHHAMLSNSRGPKTLFTLRASIGCEVGTPEQAARFGDVVVVAIPLEAYPSVPVEATAGKIVVDANNYYPDRDGRIAELDAKTTTTSELLASHLPTSRIVKAFNAIPATELERGDGKGGARRALPIAGDDLTAKQVVTQLQDDFGFDTFDAGSLSEGWRFEEGTPVYCVAMDLAELESALAATSR